MAPFPESESMTIKRLEVALKKKDMHLLKDGAYKLHEKFHTGHRFEFITELEQILKYAKTNDIQWEIKEILCPTIEEILSEQPNSGQKDQTQPAKQEESVKENVETKITDYKPSSDTSTDVNKQEVNKNVLIFYDDNSCSGCCNEVKNYRNKLNNLSLLQPPNLNCDFLGEIATVNNIVNSEICDIDKVFAMLKTSKNDISFVTTSQSRELTKTLNEKGIEFDIPYVQKPPATDRQENSFSLIPMLGLSNVFMCSHCNLRILKGDSSTKILSLQCPNCDSATFPDLYAINSYNPDCNPIFWYRAMKAFVKSKIWIIINPPLDENKEIIFDFIKTASECSAPEKIYIFSKENDKKEFYTNLFSKMHPKSNIYSDFLNIEELCTNYIKEQMTDKINEKY